MFTLCVDPGHGGRETGAVAEGVMEKTITLDIARKVQQYGVRLGWAVILTHDGLPERQVMTLTERVEVARKERSHALVSIHVNAAENPEAKGLEIYRQVTDPFNKSLNLAQHIYSKLLVTINPTQRGVKLRKSEKNPDIDYYGILRMAAANSIPAVIVEIGFLTNPVERRLLLEQWYLEKASLGIVWGIYEYSKRYA